MKTTNQNMTPNTLRPRELDADSIYGVHYMTRETWDRGGIRAGMPVGNIPAPKPFTLATLAETHTLVGFVAADEVSIDDSKIWPLLDEIWVRMQGENWSPRGEANAFVRSLGVHTSMSVGDIITVNSDDGTSFAAAFIVEACGFSRLS